MEGGRILARMIPIGRGLASQVLVASFLALVACGGSGGSGGGSPQGVLDGSSYVAVPRSVEAASTGALRTAALRTLASPQLAAGTSFYLAVKRSELAGKFFLAGYMEQSFPDGIKGGAAKSIGTRVVALRLEPDRLVLFDASDVNAASDLLDPTLIVEAWPVVAASETFNADPRRGEYVLVDPSAGLNQLSVLGAEVDGDYKQVPFRVGLAYLQDFKRLADGAAFRLVFTGETGEPVHTTDSDLEPNPLRVSGTLGVALRRYAEGTRFTPPVKPKKEYFFLSPPRIVRNTGEVVTTPIAWNIHEGMSPIVWTISPHVRQLARYPKYSKYKLEAAIVKGIENWNEVFGYPVFRAEVGAEGSRAGDDVTNFLWVDPDPSVDFAFADERFNPNTGEIRGASVYFNAGMVDTAMKEFDPTDPPTDAPPIVGAARPRYLIGWAGMTPASRCDRPFGPLATASSTSMGAGDSLTPEEKVEAYVTGVILHEIGHTLGLRHNFKGSMVPPSSSIMEYIDDRDQILVTTPQRYDLQALSLLYGLSEKLPVDPFCNDDDQRTDPECAKFDKGSDPLAEYFGPKYDEIVTPYLEGGPDIAWDDKEVMARLDKAVNELLAFVRAGMDSAQRIQAYRLATDRVSGLFEPAPGTVGERVNRWGAAMFERLLLSPEAERGIVTAMPPLETDAALGHAVISDVGGWLLDMNGVATFPTRRLAVDALKEVQVDEAYRELVTDRSAILGGIPVGTEPDLLTADLLARIGVALSPYHR
jgi:hypothetical protein